MTSNYDLEEISLLKLQMLLSVLFIITIIISIFLSYNETLNLAKKKPLFSKKNSQTVLTINRILVLLLGFGYLYINYADNELKKQNKSMTSKDLNHASLQIDASVLNIIASIIVLYVVLDSAGEISPLEVENPTL